MNNFVVLQSYSTTVEAEMHAEILREAGIPAILQSPNQGIFGAGFSGFSGQGVTLLVPENELDHAAELIDLPEEG
jgi:Putative prokaryotic signal transducing protein